LDYQQSAVVEDPRVYQTCAGHQMIYPPSPRSDTGRNDTSTVGDAMAGMAEQIVSAAALALRPANAVKAKVTKAASNPSREDCVLGLWNERDYTTVSRFG
jgi:hypothetical protein